MRLWRCTSISRTKFTYIAATVYMGASDSSIWITDFNLATTSTTNFKWYWFPVLLDHDIGYFYRAIFVPDGSWLGMSSFNCPKNSVTILRFKIIHNRFFYID